MNEVNEMSAVLRRGGESACDALSSQERALCLLLALGGSNVEIARRLETSARSVAIQRKRLLRKLGLHQQADLVRFALDRGLLGCGAKTAVSKHCPSCGVLWHSCDDMLADKEIRFIGYQPAPEVSRPGLLLFTHAPCQTSLALALESFRGLTQEPVFAASCTVTSRAEHCLHEPVSEPCPPTCVCHFAWTVSKMIARWPKSQLPN